MDDIVAYLAKQRENAQMAGSLRDRERDRDRDMRRRERERERASGERRRDDRDRRDEYRSRDRTDTRKERDEDNYGNGRRESSRPPPPWENREDRLPLQEEREPRVPPYDGNYSYDDDRGIDDRGADKWISHHNTHTIILKGLPLSVDENDVRGELMLARLPVREVRLMKRKDTGASRGFAFVEFQCVEDARRWMDSHQGMLYLAGHSNAVSMFYGTPKSQPPPIADRSDWICSKCAAHNFKRRDYCFKCTISRDESEKTKEGEGFEQVGSNPCNTLILRGLDALTNEDRIKAALKSQLHCRPKNLRVICDETTGSSRGYAFIELNSVSEAQTIHSRVRDSQFHIPFEVDGKVIMCDFAKNTFSTTMATIEQWAAYAYAQGQQYSQEYYEQYYKDYYAQHGYAPPQPQQSSSGSTVALAAIEQAQNAKFNQTDVPVDTPVTSAPVAADAFDSSRVYPDPDVSTYQYDETSGYYYDPLTTLYYDANSQYYYNGHTGQFMYWDGSRKTYLPAPTQTAGDATASQNQNGAQQPQQPLTEEEINKKKEEKKDGRMASKIAKDMEKWAKKLNAKKEAQKDVFQRPKMEGSATSDVGFNVLANTTERKGIDINLLMSRGQEEKKLMPPPPAPAGAPDTATSSLVPSDYGAEDSDDDGDAGEGDNLSTAEAKLVDLTKMACLLCKRQFPNAEVLQKHTQLSDLHKTNLEEFRKNHASNAQAYRDRAKERRHKMGSVPPPPRPKPADKVAVPFEQPTRDGLTEDNRGRALMAKMGWNEGAGLGKSEQGMTSLVQANQRISTAGLGAKGASYNVDPGATYKETAKKVMFARYQEIDEEAVMQTI